MPNPCSVHTLYVCVWGGGGERASLSCSLLYIDFAKECQYDWILFGIIPAVMETSAPTSVLTCRATWCGGVPEVTNTVDSTPPISILAQ